MKSFSKISLITAFALIINSINLNAKEVKLYDVKFQYVGDSVPELSDHVNKSNLLTNSEISLQAKKDENRYLHIGNIVFDFNDEDANKASPELKLSNKKIDMNFGMISSIGNGYGYKNTYRNAVIENSVINSNINTEPDYLISAIVNVPYAIYLHNSGLTLRNSEFKENLFRENTPNIARNTIAIRADYEYKGTKYDGMKNQAGLIIERDVADPTKYDLDINGNIDISYYLLNPHYGDNNKIYESVFDGEGTKTPLLKFGKNTRSRLVGISALPPDLASEKRTIPKGDVIVFEEGSDVELDYIDLSASKVEFKGGKVKFNGRLVNDGYFDYKTFKYVQILKRTEALTNAFGVAIGKAIFDIKAESISTEASVPQFVDLTYTDLEMLSGSKVDLDLFFAGFNDDDGYDLNKHTKIAPKDQRAKIFRFTFDKNSDLYIKKFVEAELVMQEGSNLHTYRFDEKDIGLSATNKPNEVKIRDKFILNNANLHFRTNVKDGLSDKLIIENSPITGTGATVYVKNNGSADTTGFERVVLIHAMKGSDSGVKIDLKNPVEIGAYEYILQKDSAELGEEYALVGERVNLFNDTEKGITNNTLPSMSKLGNLRKINPVTGNSFNINKDNVEVTSNKGKYSVSLENGNMNINESKVLIENGMGIKLVDSPAVIKNSNIYLDTKDIHSGLLIESNNSGTALKVERDKASQNKNDRDLFINGRLKIVGNNGSKPSVIGANTKVQVYNPKGDVALKLQRAPIKFEDGSEVFLEAKDAINSKYSDVSGEALFHIKGNLYHEGDGGVNLTFKEGSNVEVNTINLYNSATGSSLRFKKGSNFYITNSSNANMVFDEGSSFYLYGKDQNTKDIKKAELNEITLSGKVEINNANVYSRIDIFKGLGDSISVDGNKGFLTGKGMKVFIKNTADLEADNINREILFFTGKVDENFKFELQNEVEIGPYIFDNKFNKVTKNGITIVTFDLKEKGKRKAKLASTAMGTIENSYSDYYTELGSIDGLFAGIDNIEFSKKNSVWAKIDGSTVNTKNGFRANAKSVYTGFDRQLLNHDFLHGGIFLGNTETDKKYDEYSGKGDSSVFHGGVYLSYRGIIGDGDVILKYSKGKTNYSVLDTAGTKVSNKLDYSSKMVAFRFGKKFYPFPSEKFYIEPSIQASYGKIDGAKGIATNGLRVNQEAIKTWSTGGDIKLGYKANNFNSYIKAGISKEFLGDVDFIFNDRGVEHRQLDEGIATFGAGLEYSLGNHTFSLEAERKQSKLLKDYYRASIGYKYKF